MPFFVEFLLYYIACLSEDFMICTAIDLMLERKVFNKRKLMIFPASILAVSSHLLIPIPIIAYGGALLSGLVLFIWYTKQKLVPGFILYFLVFIIISGIQSIFMWIPQEIIGNPIFITPAFFITLILFHVIVKFLPIKKLYHYLTERNIALMIILFNTALLLEIHNMYYKVDSASYYAKIPLYVAVIIFVIFINVYSILTHIKIKNQKAILNAYNTWLPIVEQLIGQIRVIQHNYDNELQTFKALPIVHKDIDSLKQAIIDYVKKILDSDIPMSISLDSIPDNELRVCIEELNGTIENIDEKYIVHFN